MKKRRGSYTVYVVLAAAMLFSLFYESFRPRSVETVTVISGVGIEKGENGAIKLSIQAIKPKKDDGGSSTSACIVLSGEGNTVTQAVEAIVLKTGSVLFWAHCAIIVLNSELASENVTPHLDMFFRSIDFRNTASVIVTDESPEKIFNANTVFEMVSALGIRKLLDDQDFNSNSVYTSLKDLYQNYYGKSASSVVAGISVMDIEQNDSDSKSKNTASDESSSQKSQSQTSQTIRLSECAVMGDGKFKGYLTEDELNGYQWITASMNAQIMTLENVMIDGVDNTVGLSLFDIRVRTKPSVENGINNLKITVNAKMEIIYLKNELKVKDVTQEGLNERLNEINNILSDEIEREVNLACEKMKEYDCDFCGIKNLFYVYFGKEWLTKNIASVQEMISQMNIECDVTGVVVSGGLNKRFDPNG